jgi:Peptidase inhibitor I78 family
MTWLRVSMLSMVAAAWLTSACSSGSQPVTTPSPIGEGGAQDSGSATECNASRAEWAVGQAASDALLDKARQAAGASTARFLLPNQPITMEFLATRLNLELDARNIVLSLRCG